MTTYERTAKESRRTQEYKEAKKVKENFQKLNLSSNVIKATKYRMKWGGLLAHTGWKMQIKYFLDSPKRKDYSIDGCVNETITS
jgi:hypothetical protein